MFMTKTRNRYYNPNPKKIRTSDCVVRSMCKATGKDWDTVYKELFEIGFELKVMPNSDEAWKEYLKREGFIYHKLTIKKGSKRPRVAEFAQKNKTGTFVLSVAKHIVTCEDGYYYDTWDCGDYAMYGYWEKPQLT
uniref:Peptidase n=1 Tax=Bacillus phage KoopaTroopa TaxID=3234046 RepID=A0AB39C7W1_9CAUD